MHDGCDDCCAAEEGSALGPVLKAALAINLLMFVVEMGAGLAAGSAALQADALDFLGDAANYAISLAVVGLALKWRARAALVKGSTMGAFGLWVIANAIWHAVSGTVPPPEAMGVVAILAMIANGAVALMLYRFRSGDANMRSVWICARNDIIGNLAVLLAAFGVLGTGQSWPDILVALVMATLALSGAWKINRHALGELKTVAAT
jgi:Co/Zn/Cd efflux system component